MAKPNRTINLSVEDMDIIETALREQKAKHAAEDHSADEAREIHELLGRLHNQKVFYRPRNAPYVGG